VADQLTAAFTDRGVLPMCTRILEHTGTTLNGPKELSNLWFAPGTAMLDMSGKLSGEYAPGVVQMHYAIPAKTSDITVTFDRVDVSGGLGGLGGTSTPFTPKVLVKFAADPITFSDFTPITPEGEVTVIDPTEASDTFTAKFAVPEGATDLHFMIGNAGESDGAYTKVDVMAIMATDPTTSGSGGSGPASSSSGASGNNNVTDQESGCGCAVPGGDSGTTAAAVVAAAGLALAALRRRASRRPVS
jgi:MYXO-CTERM domain-containing protein